VRYVHKIIEPNSWRGVLNTTLCDEVCQWLATGRWFSPGTPVSSSNKTDRHVITEILLKVAFNIIKQTNKNMVVVNPTTIRSRQRRSLLVLNEQHVYNKHTIKE
jgi:hypothetical protein